MGIKEVSEKGYSGVAAHGLGDALGRRVNVGVERVAVGWVESSWLPAYLLVSLS